MSPEDWLAHFHERAAILEHEAGWSGPRRKRRRCSGALCCGVGGGVVMGAGQPPPKREPNLSRELQKLMARERMDMS